MHVVFHPVVNLLDHGLLLIQRLFQTFFILLSDSDVSGHSHHRILTDLGTPGAALNQKLTAWWELDFHGFMAEVRKAFKREIPLRQRDDWEGWLAFFLEGVEAAATEAERSIVSIASLIAADRRKLLTAPKVGAVSMRLFESLPMMPRFTIQQVRQRLQTTFPTATAAVKMLEGLGIVAELTGQKKNRSFSYQGYVDLLTQ